MTSVLHSTENDFTVGDRAAVQHKHHDNVLASLQHRLDVAKARHDQQLIELLKSEEKQLAEDAGLSSQPATNPLVDLWESIVEFFRGDSELHVWQTVDRRGEHWWCAYDPLTGKTLYTDSETEMRIWIEQNYTTET